MDPDQDRLRRIVRIEATFDGAESKVGTGFRIGPGQVLTAQHVVERGHGRGAIERAREVRVDLDPDGSGETSLAEFSSIRWSLTSGSSSSISGRIFSLLWVMTKMSSESRATPW